MRVADEVDGRMSLASVARTLLGGRELPAATRAARLVSVAILLGIGIGDLYWAVVQWPLHDMDVYLAAARRLQEGQALYGAVSPSYFSYLYAPWFAAAWVPLSHLPRELVAIGWSAILVAASAAVGRLLWIRSPTGPHLTLLIVPPLIAVSAGGNVQPLMVLGLLVGLNRRSGPMWVAIAASLKLTPILLCAVYVVRRQWWSAVLTLILSAVLWMPAPFIGFMSAASAVARDAAAPSLLGASAPLYVLGVVLALAATLVAPARYAALGASTASILALPRLFVYDVTLLAVGAATDSRRDAPPERRFDEQSASA